MTKRLNTPDNILIILLGLLSILPSYFFVVGIQVRFLFFIIILIYLVIFMGNDIRKLKFTHIKGVYIAYLTWVLSLTVVSIIHGRLYQTIYVFLFWGAGLFIFRRFKSKTLFLRMIDILIVFGIITSLFGIIEEFTHWNFFFLFNGGEEILPSATRIRLGVLRIMSFTAQPITYCVYLMFVISLVYYRMSLPETKRKNILRVSYMVLVITAILTVSRGAILALLLSQILLLYFSGRRHFLLNLLKITVAVTVLVGIAYVLSDNVKNIANTALITILALFSDNYATMLSSLNFGGTNINGNYERMLLYKLVWEETKDHLIIGNGPGSNLSTFITTSLGQRKLKESIEVEYLRTFFRYGLIGLISEISMFISLVIKSIKKEEQKTASWEGSLSFSGLFASIIIAYVFVLFTVMQNEDANVFFILVQLFMAYMFYGKYNNK